MATKKTATKSAPKPATSAAPASAATRAKPPVDPAFVGFTKAEESIEVDGYWVPDGGNILHGTLVSAFAFTQKTGKSRGKKLVVYVFRLLSPTLARVNGGTEERELSKGEVCAVFDTAGLRALRQLYRCEVKFRRNPEKTTLKNGNDMWEYTLGYKGERTELPIRESFGSAPDADGVNDANDDPASWADQF